METTSLRIIGGDLRSRKIQFVVDPRTRPMKDRTRESVMNLIGGAFDNAVAIDLFGGTGVLAFEAVSRGASHGIVIDILKTVSKDIRINAKNLGISDRIQVVNADILNWSNNVRDNLQSLPKEFSDAVTREGVIWVLFVCPPYPMWENEGQRIQEATKAWLDAAPDGSLCALELHEDTSEDFLPSGYNWDVRVYRPAKIAVCEKGEDVAQPSFTS